MGLSNYQLVLLDNLIYLDSILKEKKDVGGIIDILLNEKDESGQTFLERDCIDKLDGKEKCMMSYDEWLEVIQAIKADPVLCAGFKWREEDAPSVFVLE